MLPVGIEASDGPDGPVLASPDATGVLWPHPAGRVDRQRAAVVACRGQESRLALRDFASTELTRLEAFLGLETFRRSSRRRRHERAFLRFSFLLTRALAFAVTTLTGAPEPRKTVTSTTPEALIAISALRHRSGQESREIALISLHRRVRLGALSQGKHTGRLYVLSAAAPGPH
jgi:hypothetical protein